MKMLKLAAMLLITALLLAACQSKPADTGVINVSIDQTKELISNNAGNDDFVIMDIRTPAEFAQGHIAGAVNIDFSAPDFYQRISALDKNKEYLVYCRSGNRSGKAMSLFTRAGFTKVYHMHTGFMNWR